MNVEVIAAVLIYAAASSLRVNRIDTVWRTGLASQISLLSTFAATLFLPIAAAVGIGVALSLVLQLNREALDLRVVSMERRADGRFVEQPAPDTLSKHAVTMLDIYGSLQFAGARTLQTVLPDPTGSDGPAVVLRLRGRTTLGATSLIVIADYAKRLESVGGRLYLSGVDPDLVRKMHQTNRIDPDRVRTFAATAVVGESSDAALDAATEWLKSQDRKPPGRGE
jgi:sulfate permease, SulP family